MDWNDGRKLCQYLEVICFGIILDYENIDCNSFLENVILVLNIVEEKFGVRKVVMFEEFVSFDVDEFSIMVYMFQFCICEKFQSYVYIFKVDGVGIKRGVCGKIFEFFFYGCKDVGFDGVCIDVKGLSGEMIVFVEIYFEFDGFF